MPSSQTQIVALKLSLPSSSIRNIYPAMPSSIKIIIFQHSHPFKPISKSYFILAGCILFDAILLPIRTICRLMALLATLRVQPLVVLLSQPFSIIIVP